MHYEEVEDLKLEDEKQKIVKHHKLNNKRQEKTTKVRVQMEDLRISSSDEDNEEDAICPTCSDDQLYVSFLGGEGIRHSTIKVYLGRFSDDSNVWVNIANSDTILNS